MNSKALAAIQAVSGEWAMHPPRFAQFVERVEAGVGMQSTSQPRIQGGIAIIPLIGELSARPMLNPFGESMTTSTMLAEAQFREALRSPSVGAILFDVDSPGGSVYYTDQLARRIYDARGTKPIVAFGNGTVGSAAFWIASAADKFILAPGADAGSVGVWSVHMDMSGALEQQGVKPTLISSGKYKTEGHPFGPLNAETMEFLQSRVDQHHDDFVQALARNRGKTVNQVRKDFGEGRLFDAKTAVQRGMADDVQTVDRVLRALTGKPAKSRLVVAEAETQEWLAAAADLYQQEVEAEDKPPLVQIRSVTDAKDQELIQSLIEAAKKHEPHGADPGLLRRRLDLKEKEGGAVRGPRTFRPRAYSPDQEREDNGRFGSGGGSGGGNSEETIDNVSEAGRAWGKSLSRDQKDAIGDYTEDSERINSALRNDLLIKDSDVEMVERIDEALASASIPEDVTVYRGMDFDPGWESGESVEDAAFMSTSMNRDVAGEFSGKNGVTVEFVAPAGTHAAYLGKLSRSHSEGEVLFPRNTRLEVVSKEGSHYKMRIAATVAGGSGTREKATHMWPDPIRWRAADPAVLRRKLDLLEKHDAPRHQP